MNKVDKRRPAMRMGNPNSAESVQWVIDRYGGITDEQEQYLLDWLKRHKDEYDCRLESFAGHPVFHINKKGSFGTKILDNAHDAEITINNLMAEEKHE